MLCWAGSFLKAAEDYSSHLKCVSMNLGQKGTRGSWALRHLKCRLSRQKDSHKMVLKRVLICLRGSQGELSVWGI